MTTSRLHGSCARSGMAIACSAVVLVLAVVLAGCGKGKPVGTVAGKVQFRGQAVTEGVVTLYSAQLGFGNETAIKPDGTFVVEGLPYGPYQMAIHPAMIVDDLEGKAFPMAKPKRVDNIPEKYRNPSTSGFACDVSGRRMSVALEME